MRESQVSVMSGMSCFYAPDARNGVSIG